jgi:hypothetical protein
MFRVRTAAMMLALVGLSAGTITTATASAAAAAAVPVVPALVQISAQHGPLTESVYRPVIPPSTAFGALQRLFAGPTQAEQARGLKFAGRTGPISPPPSGSWG